MKGIKKIGVLALTAAMLLGVVPQPIPDVKAADEPEKAYVSNELVKEVTASSFAEGYGPEKVVDGIEDDRNNCWHTPWDADAPTFPHWIQVEFSEAQTIDSLVYVARDAAGLQFITSYEVWISPDNNEENLQKVTEGTWERAKTAEAKFKATSAALVRFVAREKVDSNYNDTYSASASELKFGLASQEEGSYDEEIDGTLERVKRLLEYASADVGSGEHQFTTEAVDILKEAKNNLEALTGSGDGDAVWMALEAAKNAIDGLLASNKAEEEALIGGIPHTTMTATANTENDGYEAAKAVDGDLSTIWHSQWTPENTEHPHELTIDLGYSFMLDKIKITPRQDMGSGRITKGELYAGNTLDAMELVAEFRASSITEISVDYRQARYLCIKALEGSDANTAIAEVAVDSYDRGRVLMLNTYSEAEDLLGNAQTGDEIGQYSKETKEEFRTVLDSFSESLKEERTNSECYKVAEKIQKEKEKFADKVNRYGIKDLKEFIKQAQELAQKLEGKDKKLMEAAIKTAQDVAGNKDSTAVEIHEAAVALKATLDGMSIAGENHYSLAGKWDFKMGAYTEGEALADNVTLPGTLDENKKGSYNSFKDPRRLSRYYVYTGPASFERQVFIPNAWEGKQITLFMERSRETRVWVNDVEILAPDSSNLMAVSQTYNLTSQIKFGELNIITIEVDNSYTHSPKDAITTSSMATEETQTNWNGIVGAFELRAKDAVNISDLRVYPNKDLKSAAVEVDVQNNSAEDYSGRLTVQAEGLTERELVVSVKAGEQATISVPDYDMGASVKLWSEFEQNLYTMKAQLDNGEKAKEKFGMRVFEVDKDTKQLMNNGKKVFLRNEANCAVFPLTAYAPMDDAGWEKLFASYQSFGINSVRFHSWCPPDAAFRVADRMGMYLQPELSSWDPGSMFGDDTEKEYFTKEAHAIIKEYANHPSFVMFTFGNELHFAGGGYEYADALIGQLKEADSTRLYSFASNSDYGSTKPTSNSDFFTGQVYNGTSMRGIYAGMSGFINQTRPASTANYNDAIQRAAKESGVPAFSFEVGQFQVFPDVLTELERYTGVLEPRNLQLVEARLAEKGVSDETTKKFIDASGMLSRIGYRMEIEAALRTKNMSGISLLGIQDFSGQSTALVGMMNALGEAKPYDFANPEEFATFFSPETALLETEKFVWTNDEEFKGKLMLANYGPDDMSGKMFYRLSDGKTTVAEGKTDNVEFKQGDVTTAEEITISLAGVKEPKQLKLTIGLGDVENYYDIWVYPSGEKASEGDVYITEFLDEEAMYVLGEGGKVLLTPDASKTALPNSITGTFTTAFWSSQFVSESQPGSMGLLMDPEHPVFDGFPTEYHSNYQWWPMAKLGRPMVLENLTQEDGTKIQPLVQVLDSFSTIRTMGLLYEARIGEGKLMVSSMGLEQLRNDYPEARALKNSILNYMNSDEFDPQFEVNAEQINESVIGTETKSRHNVVEKSNGGNVKLGENTITCQIGYDNNPQDRALELNDGRIDVETPSRSWTDWNTSGNYPNPAEIMGIFDKSYTVDTVELPFFEDSGCKAPQEVIVEYLDEENNYVLVSNPSMTTGFVKGTNTITFDAVTTSEIRITMKHQEGMGIALSEFIVYEKEIPAESIKIVSKDDKTTVELGSTLELGISYQPENANDTKVRWSVLDENGEKSALAKVSISGVLKPSAEGTVYVRAALKSNPEITDTVEIKIVKEGEDPDKPIEPDKPIDPDKPVDPDKPDTPDKPGTSDGNQEQKPGNGNKTDKVETGDSANMDLWAVILVLAFGGIVGVCITKKRRGRKR